MKIIKKASMNLLEKIFGGESKEQKFCYKKGRDKNSIST